MPEAGESPSYDHPEVVVEDHGNPLRIMEVLTEVVKSSESPGEAVETYGETFPREQDTKSVTFGGARQWVSASVTFGGHVSRRRAEDQVARSRWPRTDRSRVRGTQLGRHKKPRATDTVRQVGRKTAGQQSRNMDPHEEVREDPSRPCLVKDGIAWGLPKSSSSRRRS